MLQDDITEKVEAILQRVFTGERRVVRKLHDRINFACPYCGDSESDQRKKRANIYWDSMRFYCFNSGCQNPKANLLRFFRDHGERLDSIDAIEAVSERIVSSRPEHNSDLGFSVFNDLQANAVPIADLERAKGLIRVEDSRFAADYLRKRCAYPYRDRFRYRPYDNTLYLLNVVSDRLVGYQVGRFGGGPKYMSFNLEKLHADVGGKLTLEGEALVRANTLSIFFWLLSCDFARPVTVFEGVIDSLFVPNSLAITGLSKDISYFSDGQQVRYMLDNDRSGYVRAAGLLKTRRPVFMWKKFLKDHRLDEDVKDLNQLVVIAGNKCLEDLEAYFTSDPRDLVYL